MKKIPKGILNHPGVADVFLDDSTDRPLVADVILKDDWHFAGLDGNAARDDEYNKRINGRFDTLKEFNDAKPTQYQAP